MFVFKNTLAFLTCENNSKSPENSLVIHIQSVTIGSLYLTVEKKLLSPAYPAPGEGRGQGVRNLF